MKNNYKPVGGIHFQPYCTLVIVLVNGAKLRSNKIGLKKADIGTRPSSGIVIGRASKSDRPMALTLLLTGHGDAIDRQAIVRFEQHVRDQGLDDRELWLAKIDDRGRISTLIVPNAGRTGMVFLSPMMERMLVPVAGKLLEAAAGAQDEEKITLVQGLLDPGQQLEHQAMIAAGFVELAQLIYMQRVIASDEGSGEIGSSLRVECYEQSNHELFARAIESSYIDTMDCPGLVGMRDIEDIIAGHKSAGKFTAEHWFVLVDGKDPVGVMLFNDVPDQQGMELVYIGLSPRHRGHGLGRLLMRYAIGLASRGSYDHMLLAVDERNAPAMSLYKSLGFKPTSRKVAMIFTLSK